MDGRTKNKGAKGNKGGGRKTFTNEMIRAAVIDKSWSILLDYLNIEAENDYTAKEKRQIALEIAKKTIPQKIDGELSGNIILQWATE